MCMLLVGCHTTSKYEVIKERGLDILDVTLHDTIAFENSYANERNTARNAYDLLYIGELKDSITLGYQYQDKTFAYKEGQRYHYPDTSSLSVFVDTTKVISDLQLYPQEDNEPFKGYYAHPVFIRNKTEDTLFISEAEIIFITMEAQDSTGEWKLIQRPGDVCTMGEDSYYLLPNNCAITSSIIYQGEYKTKLRLLLGEDYKGSAIISNEFDGSINYSQFYRN